jgi:hypothetical protein
MQTIKSYVDSSYKVKRNHSGFYLFHGSTELKSFTDQDTAIDYCDYVYHTGNIPQDDNLYSL